MLIQNNTPIEEYEINGRKVFVKREDLSSLPPCPALAKLRGVYKRLEKLKEQGVKIIGVMDTRVSKSGIGCSAIANEIGLKVINFYPHLVSYKTIPIPENQQKVLNLGHIIFGLKGGRTAVLYSQMKKICKINEWYPMPLGLVVEESVDGVIKECENLSFIPDNLIISVGSGMMLAGVSIALAGKVKNIIGISAGMSPERQRGRIRKLLGIDLPSNVKIIKSEKGYYEPEEFPCPFPCSIWYDRKAFKWLNDNIDSLDGSILFWNIGV